MARGSARPTPTNNSPKHLPNCSARAVLTVNRVGFEDGLCFWGGSLIVGPDGRTIAQAPMLDAALMTAAFDPAELRRQRLITPPGPRRAIVADDRGTNPNQATLL